MIEYDKIEAIIESIMFSAGREVKKQELMALFEISEDDITNILENMIIKYSKDNKGIEIIRVDDSYQMCAKKEFFEYIYPIFDKRYKPNLSQAALETLAIISYNPKITRSEIEAIRGVNSDGTIYRLLDYNLIEEAGKLDAPGRPTTYKTTSEFLKLFGMQSLEELPELPKYKLDENQQIIIDDFIEKKDEKTEKENPVPAEGTKDN